ncbi:VWA domain-containing protein [Rossellomorea vietnamensis]|uniref:VWA domain-containing protein n=1 Tax=Rossellomorea vietnamensis TaxID=218284 RepID=A0ACD4C8V3_9BACI|nr:vWA domain-containing protein [Rossellomorea vietnamensis]UXH45104.1 VWA domain-containing protein [Rossellomorea vietnamensis]
MNREYTEIIFLLDRSGSMRGLEQETIGGYNSFIEKQRQLTGKTLVTTVLFDDKVEQLWSGMDACKVRLTGEEYFVRGCTALLDAIGKTIIQAGHRLSHMDEVERPGKVIFVITTDGMENASVEFSASQVKELINQQQKRYNWEFIFLGANINASQEALNIGIDIGNAYQFEASSKGVEEMYDVVSEAVFEKRHKW